ncbi:MAG: VWA domain-containing protein [Thermoleophilia bacterium]|nr:VWA domain-containing protein [Thermoleophilia bacterium]
MADPEQELAGFGRALRDEGVGVGTGAIIDFCRAATLTPDLYWAGRATLVASEEEVRIYDRVFARYFRGEPAPPRPREQQRAPNGSGADALLRPSPRPPEGEPELARASAVELLKRKRFSRCSPEELAELAALMARIRLAVPPRRARRRRPAKAGVLDLRRTLRKSFRTGGDPLWLARRERPRRPRRLVLLLDVSGSMADYSRALLVFAHALARGNRGWEVFCFGTRLTRVTPALATVDPDAALSRAADAVADWDGGTRIGDSLTTFLDRFGHGGMARGSVALVCSDGLDVGDPAVLAAAMDRLSRLAHAVVWLNPLKEDPAYEPLARGMRAALPHVDVFASGHDLASLETLTEELRRL